MRMKYIKAPTGEIFSYENCEIFDDGFCNKTEAFLNTENQENQEKLAKELFENTGILVCELKGDENTG